MHFRNAERKLRQAVTMHPHGVRYTPDHDGVYLGDQTRPGGFIEPGETYTYLWETEEAWADTCRQLVLTLEDGKQHRVDVRITAVVPD